MSELLQRTAKLVNEKWSLADISWLLNESVHDKKRCIEDALSTVKVKLMSIKIQDVPIPKETFYIERTACLEKEKQR